MPPRRGSFWSSATGIITAIGGLLAAVAGLITALYTTRIIGNRPEPTVAATSSSAPAPQTRSAEIVAPAPPAKVVRTDAKSTARAILIAYREADLRSLAGFAKASNQQFFFELAEQGKSHPQYDKIFGYNSWRARVVSEWDGNLREVRYRHLVGQSVNMYEARVKFADMGPDEVAVVTLNWENGNWVLEDINSPSPEDFLKGSPTFRLTEAPY